jgi:hypothetical protein
MSPSPAPWSLEWSSDGELSPLDRQDLFLCLQLPGIAFGPRAREIPEGGAPGSENVPPKKATVPYR